jgi:transcriptional regulator with XRE-family HTH domain
MTVPEPSNLGPEYSDLDFRFAVEELLARVGMTLRELAFRAGTRLDYLGSVLATDSRRPKRPLLESVARALSVQPSYFREDRARSVVERLRERPDQADAVFVESLSEFERTQIDPSKWSCAPFGEAVRSQLHAQGLTQGDIAEDAELHQATLSQILNGGREASMEEIEQIAGALGVAPESILEYRLAVVRDWLEENPKRLNALFGNVEPAALEPYRAWEIRPLPSPLAVDARELLRSLVEIVRVEGPVVGARVYSLRLAAAGLRDETIEVRRLLNRAAYAAVRGRILLAENETGEARQKFLTLRLPGSPKVVIRARGERGLCEIPAGEVAAMIRRTLPMRRGEPIAAIQQSVVEAYGVGRLTVREVEYLNRCINRARSLDD